MQHWDSYIYFKKFFFEHGNDILFKNFNFQEGHLCNGDHLLQVGDVRLWGMGAQQVLDFFNKWNILEEYTRRIY